MKVFANVISMACIVTAAIAFEPCKQVAYALLAVALILDIGTAIAWVEDSRH